MEKKLPPLSPVVFLLLSIASVSFSQTTGGSTVSSGVALAGNSTAPTASFEWSVPERFGTKTKKGLIDYHWNEKRKEYESEYINPISWRVNFDACTSLNGATAITSYALEVSGQRFAKGGQCKFSHEFPTQGTYPVTLIVTGADGQTGSTHMDIVVRDILIVSIGDSIAAGQGSPDVPRDPLWPTWINKKCYRSANAGPAQVAMKIEKDDPKTSVTFISYACSGAEIQQGLLGPYLGLPPQLTQMENQINNRRVDALLVSIGANDANFSKLVFKAIRLKHCDTDPKTKKLLDDGLEDLPRRYERLASRLRQMPQVARVFITEYPDIVRDEGGNFCSNNPSLPDPLHAINSAEAKWAFEKVITPLNALVEAAATLHGWTFVDGIAAEFRGTSDPIVAHGYCSGNKRWVRTFNDSWKYQTDSKGTLHPNPDGYAIYAKQLLRKMQESGALAAPQP